MIPLRDANPARRRPVVTVLLIGICVGVFVLVEPVSRFAVHEPSAVSAAQADAEFSYRYAVVPCEVTRERPLTPADLRLGCQRHSHGVPPVFPHKNVWLAILYSMFLHASLLHIAGNMLYLWIFGNNVEDRLGHVGYLVFYLAAGAVATLAFIAFNPFSTDPLLGASGAIAAVMGAYLVMFPRAPIRTLIIVPPIILWPRIPAWVLLVFWFVSQFFVSPTSGVAWVAHVAGFVSGLVVAAALPRRAGLVRR